MIILTGAKGFIGKCFAERLDDEVILVDQEDAWRLFTDFDKWDKVNLILHQGAISSTTEKDLQKLWHYNVAFSCALLNKAIEYQIPIKYGIVCICVWQSKYSPKSKDI